VSVRHEHFVVTGTAHLDIRTASGEITVRTGVVGEVRVTIEGADAEDFVVSQLGDTITIGHDSRWRIRSRSVRVAIETPPGSGVDLATATADVRLTGALGAARIKTATGDVSVDRADRLEISTASGDCRIGEIDDDARVNAVAGTCSGRGVGGRFSASTASGDIRIARVGGDVDVATTSGDIRIERCDGDDISIRSVSGDVSVGLPTGVRVDADLSTLSGRTTLPEPASSPAPTSPSSASPSATSGEPRRPVRLRLRSVSGDLRVDRAVTPG
jgi:DUF4097 and DUF4098 domain-containing protein YvlB